MEPNTPKKRTFRPLTRLRTWLCVGLLGAGVASQAATIAWQSPSNITLNAFGQLSANPGSTTDPYLGGTTKYAYTWGPSAPYNAVPGELVFIKTNVFNGSTLEGNLTVSGFAGILSESSFFNTYAGLPTSYKNSIASAITNSGAMCTITLSNLTIGTSYAVQVWVDDSSASSGRTNTYATVANTVGNGGAGVDLLYNVNSLVGGVGQYVLGTFTADTNYQDLTIQGKVLAGQSGTACTVLNAIQLRDLTPSQANMPVFNNPVPGTYMGAQNILVAGESGSTVYYTIDNTSPDTNSSPSGVAGSGYALVSIPAGQTTTIKAVAIAPSKFKTLSIETNATYTTTATGTGIWTTVGGGTYTNAINWTNGIVPNGPDTIADFSTRFLTGTARVTNTVTTVTNGGMLFDDQSGNHNGWAITNNTINLNNNFTTPFISNNVPLLFSSALTGVGGFVKTGSGTMTLLTSATISGNVYVENSTLQLGQSALTSADVVLGTANSGSATTTFGLAPVTTTSNGVASAVKSITISSAAPSSTAVINGNANSTNWGVVNSLVILQGGRSVTFTNSSAFFYKLQRNISGNGDVIVATPSYASRVIFNPTNSTTGNPVPTNNTWVGNLRITSGAVQITDGFGTGVSGKDAIPDTADVIMSANTILAFAANETFGALNGEATAVVGEEYVSNGIAFNMTLGANNHDGVFNGNIWLNDVGTIANANMPLQITKIGTGSQTFNGNCSNTAPTLVGGGKLVINSAYFASPVTVSNAATLGGVGTLSGAVAIQAGGTLAPGTNLVGTLTINNNLALAGKVLVKVDKSLSPAQSNDLVTVTGTLNNSGTGTLTISNLNLAQPFAPGDKFTVFSQPLVNGGAMIFSPATPGPNLIWVNNLAVDGTVSVLELPPTLSNLVITPAGTLNPAFATNGLNYTATNAYLDNPVTVTATAANPGSTLELSLNGAAYAPLTSAVASAPQTLVLPSNTLAVRVTSADTLTNQIYTVNVTLQPSLVPAPVTSAVAGNSLTLSWPADHLGWHLEMQTNTLGAGLTTSGWVAIPGTDSVTQTNISISQTNPTAFFRITYP